MTYTFQTDFGRYRIEDVIYNGRPARVLYSEDNMSAQSGVPADGKPAMLFDYNQRFLELIDGIRPKHVLILGGGAFTLPAAFMKAFPEMRIDVVEIDGGLFAIAQKYFDFEPGNRVRVHIDDGGAFVARTNQTYDAVIIDVFFNDEIPPVFQTVAFADTIRNCVSKQGFIAINVIASQAGRNAAPLRTMADMLQNAFPVAQIFPATRSLSPWMLQNYIVAAQNGLHEMAGYLGYAPIDL